MRLLQNTLRLQPWLLAATGVLVTYTMYFIFFIVPNERMMGPVQRIFYFHVGSALASYFAIAVVFLCSILFLWKRVRGTDALSRAGAEVGLLFCSMVLASGMIWAQSAWNTWFRWEPRLVSFLMFWFIFLALNLLRAYGNEEKIPAHSAVLGIVGMLTVPVIVFSVKLLAQDQQLHPQVLEQQGLRDPLFVRGMFLGIGSMLLLCLTLILTRTRIALLEEKLIAESKEVL